MGTGGGSQRGLSQVSGDGEGEEACPGSAVCSEAGVGVRIPPQGAGVQSQARQHAKVQSGSRAWTADPRAARHSDTWRSRWTPTVGWGVPVEPPTRTQGCPGLSAGQSPPARGGRGAARVSRSWTIPSTRRSAEGPFAERRPLARGRRTEAERRGKPGGGTVVPCAALHIGTRWSCAPWRGGGEAGKRPWLLPPGVPRVTAAAAILPYTDPPPSAGWLRRPTSLRTRRSLPVKGIGGRKGTWGQRPWSSGPGKGLEGTPLSGS
jgi:hypothetical protein